MKLNWDAIGERFYETGIDHGVLYPAVNGQYPKGVAWNGFTNVSESPSGAEQTALYADNIKYLTLTSAEEFGLTIEAYTYPDEWEACDGSAEPVAGVSIGQQVRTPFGLVFKLAMAQRALLMVLRSDSSQGRNLVSATGQGSAMIPMAMLLVISCISYTAAQLHLLREGMLQLMTVLRQLHSAGRSQLHLLHLTATSLYHLSRSIPERLMQLSSPPLRIFSMA